VAAAPRAVKPSSRDPVDTFDRRHPGAIGDFLAGERDYSTESFAPAQAGAAGYLLSDAA